MRNRAELAEAQGELAAVSGVTVLIYDQRCAAELRRDRKRGKISQPRTRVAINHRVCEGCGHCAEISNCLSVQPFDTPFGRKTTIEQDSCNVDLSCLEGDCPAFVTVTRPKRPRRNRPPAPAELPTPPSPIPAPPMSASPDVNIHITGIGGTGVVTTGQLIATAAMLDGSNVQGLDQIGLSQKAGPVVSDLRITRQDRSGSNRLGDRQADLLLAFDLLVAASATGLDAADSARTAVVGSLDVVPPGAKTAHPEIDMPTAPELLERVQAETRSEAQFWAKASDLTQALVGDAVGTNVFVVGMAVQTGLLPVTPEALETAIELNGVAVELNTAAFRWGRWWVADQPMVEATAAGRAETVPHDARTLENVDQSVLGQKLNDRVAELADGDTVLAAALELFTAELVRFQNRAMAGRYLEVVAEFAATERQVNPGSASLTAAVAAGLFKLTAYKDEYEVARLLLDSDGHAPAVAAAQPGDRLAWLLHPPVLRAMGRKNKITFSVKSWRPMIALLAKGKRLRGTPFDPFGLAKVRRQERQLPSEYLTALRQAVEGATTPDDLQAAQAIAEAADLVRGYENIKLANIERFRAAINS